MRATVNAQSRLIGCNDLSPVIIADKAPANVAAALKALTSHARSNSAAHRIGIKVIWHQAAAHILVRALCVFRSFFVVNGLIATHQANGFGMLLFNILRHEADLGAIIALVLIAIDRLSIIGLADFPDIIL